MRDTAVEPRSGSVPAEGRTPTHDTPERARGRGMGNAAPQRMARAGAGRLRLRFAARCGARFAV